MKKQLFKFCFDLGMAILFVLLFPAETTGLAFHEIAGVNIGLAILIHLALNGKWGVNTTKKIFMKSLPWKTRISYLLNLLLVADSVAFTISGLLVSEVLFPNLRYFINIPWLPIHMITSFAALVLIGIHLGLHWNWIQNMGKQFMKNKTFSFRKPLFKYARNFLLVIGTIGLLTSLAKLVMLTTMLATGDAAVFAERGEHGRFEHRADVQRGVDLEQGVDGGSIDQERLPDREREEFEKRSGREGRSSFLAWMAGMILFSSQFAAAAFYTHLIERRLLRKHRAA